MADSTARGNGAGGSGEGNPPKRPRVDEQEPEVSSSQPSAEGRRRDPQQGPSGQQPSASGSHNHSGQQPAAGGSQNHSGQQPGASGSQNDPGQQPAASGSQNHSGQQPSASGSQNDSGQQPAAAGSRDYRGRGIISQGLLQGRARGRGVTFLVPGLSAPDPGPLIDPLLWSKLSKQERRRLIRQHKARLERYWDTVIRFYRSLNGRQPAAPQGAAVGAQGQGGAQLQVQVYIPAAGGAAAQQGGIPANAANVAAAGDQEAPQAPDAEPAVEDAQDEQAVPDVYGVGDGEGGNAEAEPKM